MKYVSKGILGLLAVCLLLSFLPVIQVRAEAERSLSTDKTVYEVGETILVTATGEDTDYVVVYQKDKTPGVNGGIYYACFDNTITGRESYTKLDNGVASDLLKWACPTPENPNDVKPFIDAETKALKEGNYKIVVRATSGSVLATKEFTITAGIERSLSLNKEVYEEGEPIMVTATGGDTDSVVLYLKDSVPGQNAGIYYAYFTLTETTQDYTVIQPGVALDLFDFYCPTPDNAEVKPYIDIPAGAYKVVMRNKDGTVVAEQPFIVKGGLEPVETGDADFLCACICAAAVLAGAVSATKRRMRRE